MCTISEVMKVTKPGMPYKFFEIETGADITEKVVFNLSYYGEKIITSMIMKNNTIYYYI